MPMIEVAGASGMMLVFRPWSDHDMDEAIESLPYIVGNRKDFAAELEELCMTFCPTGAEIRCIIKRKLKAADAAKLTGSLPKAEVRITKVPSDGGTSTDAAEVSKKYYAVTKLCRAIINEFPTKPNLTHLHAVKQKPTEAAENFLYRLEEAFESYTGLTQP